MLPNGLKEILDYDGWCKIEDKIETNSNIQLADLESICADFHPS
jgi:hypothetical protein